MEAQYAQMSKVNRWWLSQIHLEDCIEGMGQLPQGAVDLAFADPPFNIGYQYDVYDDKKEYQQYIDWSSRWIAAVYRALKPDGAFWLAIGDEYAAELKLECQKQGFHCRSWVIWYYTFGVNCKKKFTRSHAHLLYFVKNPAEFTFRDEELDNRVPSARELVYNDKRASPRGRLPDDTWILRPGELAGDLQPDTVQALPLTAESGPAMKGATAVTEGKTATTVTRAGDRQADELTDELSADETEVAEGVAVEPASSPDEAARRTVGLSIHSPSDNDRTFVLRPQALQACFDAKQDTWYVPRVAGTFKERAGFHGCQMPEQLLGRIIRTCSAAGEVVLDPFSGSATTLAVAKKLGRQFVGFEISEEYVTHGRARLERIRVGDPLDGSPEPLKSTHSVRGKTAGTKKAGQRSLLAGSATSVADDVADVADVPDVADEAASRGKPHEQQHTREQHTHEQHRTHEQQRLIELTRRGVIDAFLQTHEGFSVDRLVADPCLNRRFLDACRELGLAGEPRSWNFLLFDARRHGEIQGASISQATEMSWEKIDAWGFASEIAWQRMLNRRLAESLDETICDPRLAAEFDEMAQRFAPGHQPFDYRWAAIMIRRQAETAQNRAAVLRPPRWGETIGLGELDLATLPADQGLYLVSGEDSGPLYIGETYNLRNTISLIQEQIEPWREFSARLRLQICSVDVRSAGRLAWQCRLVGELTQRPLLNSVVFFPSA